MERINGAALCLLHPHLLQQLSFSSFEACNTPEIRRSESETHKFLGYPKDIPRSPQKKHQAEPHPGFTASRRWQRLGHTWDLDAESELEVEYTVNHLASWKIAIHSKKSEYMYVCMSVCLCVCVCMYVCMYNFGSFYNISYSILPSTKQNFIKLNEIGCMSFSYVPGLHRHLCCHHRRRLFCNFLQC